MHGAYRAHPVPRTDERPVDIVDSTLQERILVALAALSEEAGHKRKCRVANDFDVILRALTNNERGWQTAPDADLFEWLCWWNLHGIGKIIGARIDVPESGFGLQLAVQCRRKV